MLYTSISVPSSLTYYRIDSFPIFLGRLFSSPFPLSKHHHHPPTNSVYCTPPFPIYPSPLLREKRPHPDHAPHSITRIGPILHVLCVS
jgi:hypothetical protein